MAHVGQWQHGLCGCFDNMGICIISYLVPCYTFGKNAEAVGEDCLKCGVAYIIPFANIFFAASMRGRIRDQKGIEGTFINDVLMICCCPLCALVQEAQEVQDVGPPIGGVAMNRQ